MADTVTPSFNITREQIAAFVKDPRTVRDIEAFIRMVREQLPSLLFAKVDESRQVLTDGTLTGGGDLSADRTLGINITAETERIQDVIGASLTDTATIDFTYVDATGLITADLKNTAVTAGSYGDATHVASFTVDAQGRLTAASNVAISVTGATTANAVTFNVSGGAAAGSTFNGSAALTVDYSTVGAAPRSPSVQSVSSASTVTPTFSDDGVKITAQAAALTLANPSGTAVSMWGWAIRIKDNGTARAISYGTQYRAIGVTLPTTTVVNKTVYLGCIWNNDDTKVDVVAVAQEA
jgi:hypothetical protein